MTYITHLMMFLMFLTAVFLIVLVLIQRGKGGGLAGAFGGLGGQSAFGTKAGDLFTRVTIGVAAFWIVLCMITVVVLRGSGGGILDSDLEDKGPPKDGMSAPLPTDEQTAGSPPATPAKDAKPTDTSESSP